jgi:hypothetical protein
MRNFSLVSIILALAAGALIWQKLIVNSTPEPSQPASSYSSNQSDRNEGSAMSEESDAGDSGFESDEQQEMADQQSRSHDIMMKSFDKKYDQYREGINGQ